MAEADLVRGTPVDSPSSHLTALEKLDGVGGASPHQADKSH